MRLPTLLLVDDDHEFIKAQTAGLESDFEVISAEGVSDGLQILQNREVDCVIVDYFLNDGNGHDVANWIALNRPWCPVLLVSARLDKKIAVDSFTYRVFDILEKPYGLELIQGKVQLALAEFKGKKELYHRQMFNDVWSLDRDRRIFRFQENIVELTSTEVKILEVLTVASRQVVSREKMVETIWGSMSVADNTLDTHLTNLRRKAPFLKTLIKGVRGIGYVFEP